MSVRRTLIVIAGLMAVFTLILVASGSLGVVTMNESAPDDFITPYTVAKGDVRDTISAVGRLEANQTVNMSFQGSGRVTEILVRAGDTVQPGMVLARLDDTIARSAYDQAMLAYESAQIAVQELVNAPTETELAAAEAALISAQGSYTASVQSVTPEDVQAAELRYQQAQQQTVALRQARATMMGDLASQEYQLADARVGSASFSEEIARLQVENLRIRNRGSTAEAGASVTLAQLQLERTRLGARPEQIAIAQAAVERAEVRVIEAQIALDNTALRASISGIVTRVALQVGQTVDPSVIAIEIGDVSQVWLTANVDEVDIDRVFVGLPAEVHVDALPGQTFVAATQQIALLPVLVNGVVNYPTRFRVENTNAALRVGMTAEVRVILDERQNVLTIPNEYLTLDGDRASVTRLMPDGAFIPTEAVVGLRGDQDVEIISGVQSGDQLVTLPADFVQPGGTASSMTASADATLLPIELATVERGTLPITISTTGKIAPIEQTSLAFETAAIVRDLHVSVGQTVSQGEVIARIDVTDLQTALLNAQAALIEAEANYHAVIAPPRNIDVRIAEAELASAQTALYAAGLTAPTQYDEEIAQLQIDLANNSLWQAQLNRDLAGGGSGLWVDGTAGNATTVNGINTARSEIGISQTNYENTINRDANAGSLASASGRLEQAQVALDTLLRGATVERQRRAEIEVENSRLAVQQAEERLSQAEMRAPFDGVIAQIGLIPGQIASRDRTVTVIRAGGYTLNLTVNESDIAAVEPDQTVEIRLDALRERAFDGIVTSIDTLPTAPSASSTSQRVTYTVRVRLDSADAVIRPGMSTTGNIVLEQIEDALYVPTRFLRTDPDTFESLLIVPGEEPGVYLPIVVTIGARNRELTQIVSGVEVGQPIVIPPDAPASDAGTGFSF